MFHIVLGTIENLWATMLCWKNTRKGSIKMIDVKIELNGKKFNYQCKLFIFFVYFLVTFLAVIVSSWAGSFFRGRFLGRVRVFLDEFFFPWTLSLLSACFLEGVLFFVDACMISWQTSFFLDRMVTFFSLSFFYYKFPALSRNLERKERCTPSSLAGSWCPCRGPGGKGLT